MKRAPATEPDAIPHARRVHTQRLLMALLVAIIVMILVALFCLQLRVNNLPSAKTETGQAYRYHFAMVVDNDDTPFWQLAYQGAQQRAAQLDSRVELISTSLVENYALPEQLQMAAYAGVDGIFVVPDGEKNTNAVIGEIVQNARNPIPVLTLMENDSNSGRSGYVGINNYEQGLAYGRQISRLASEKTVRSVILLASSVRDEDQKGGYSGDVIYSSIIEHLTNSGLNDDVAVSVCSVDHQNVFTCEKDIKQLFMDGDVPDVLICPDYLFTISAAQVLVDQNLVGQATLLGASMSEDILEYIRMGTIDAVVTIDPYLLGSVSVDGMLELMQGGRTNDFTALETILIDSENVDKYTETYIGNSL